MRGGATCAGRSPEAFQPDPRCRTVGNFTSNRVGSYHTGSGTRQLAKRVTGQSHDIAPSFALDHQHDVARHHDHENGCEKPDHVNSPRTAGAGSRQRPPNRISVAGRSGRFISNRGGSYHAGSGEAAVGQTGYDEYAADAEARLVLKMPCPPLCVSNGAPGPVPSQDRPIS